jgi:cyclophilin family peptidyl-prolyl cis-trans isomerase
VGLAQPDRLLTAFRVEGLTTPRLEFCIVKALALTLLLVALMTGGCNSSAGNPKVPPGAKSSGGTHAVIDTDKGAIGITFFASDAPKAVENFRLLAEHGYYDGLVFHRIVRDFMIQGGDPAGDGTGGQSAWGPPFEDEINPQSPLYRGGYRRGLVAMANSGPNTNGSQFFICTDNLSGRLPKNYTLFGVVTKGLDVVDRIVSAPRDGRDLPHEPVAMTSVTIHED